MELWCDMMVAMKLWQGCLYRDCWDSQRPPLKGGSCRRAHDIDGGA